MIVADKQYIQSVNKGHQGRKGTHTSTVRVDGSTTSKRLGSSYVQKNINTEKEAGQNGSVTQIYNVTQVHEEKQRGFYQHPPCDNSENKEA